MRIQTPNLRHERRRQLLTQRELAQRAGIRVMTVVNLERGTYGRPTTVRKIAHALGVEPTMLLGDNWEERAR